MDQKLTWTVSGPELDTIIITIIVTVTDLLHVRAKRQPWTEDWAKQTAYKKYDSW